MNLFKRELKSYRRSILYWSIGMVMLIWSGMLKYANIKAVGQSANDLIAQLPQSIQTIFGMTGFDLTKISGYYGVLFMYVALMATVHAVLIGADIISKEERDRTSDFLLTKPISRFKIITTKLLAGLFNLVVLNLVTLASSIYFVDYYAGNNASNNDILILMGGLFILQLIFFFVGTMMASIVKRPKLSASAATSILLLTFVLTIFININKDFDFLKYLTPFKYFDAKLILADGHLDPLFMSISALLVAVMAFVTYKAYNARDLAV